MVTSKKTCANRWSTQNGGYGRWGRPEDSSGGDGMSPGRGSRPLRTGGGATHLHSWCGYEETVGATKVSLMERGLAHRDRFCAEPALSLVPEARAPPNGC